MDVTIDKINNLHESIENMEDKSIGAWKRVVKKFATENDLTDREAIEIARMDMPEYLT